MMSVILRVVTRMSFSDDAEIQAECVEKVLVEMLPMATVRIIFLALIYDMQMTIGSSHGAYITETFVDSAMQRQGMRELGTHILSVVLQYCSSLRYELISLVNEYGVAGHDIRISFLTDVLGRVANLKNTAIMEELLHTRDKDPTERILHKVDVEMPQQSGGFFSSGPEYVSRMLVLTNKRVLVMERPKHTGLGHVCTHCDPAKFCPLGPTVGSDMSYAKLTRIVRGSDSQMIVLCWAKHTPRSQPEERYDVVICHDSDASRLLVRTLHTMSGPKVESRIYPLRDQLIHKRLTRLAYGSVVATTWAYRVLPKSSRFSLFVLTSSALKEVRVVWAHWVAPVDDQMDDSGEEDAPVQHSSDDEEEKQEHHRGSFSPTAMGRKFKTKAQERLNPASEERCEADNMWAQLSDAEVRRLLAIRDEAKTSVNVNLNSNRSKILEVRQSFEVTGLQMVEFDGGEAPVLTLQFAEELVTIRFLDDVARERWRRAVADVLNKWNHHSQWQRNWDSK